MTNKIVEIKRDYKKDVLLGIAVGDAMGLPYEFLARDEISISSGALMIGFGSHHQEPGTFSDDSSLTFCTVIAIDPVVVSPPASVTRKVKLSVP